MNERDCFSSGFDDFNFLDSEGNKVDNIAEYLKKVKDDRLSFISQLNVGDIVKIKSTGDIMIIKYINYEIFGMVYDYAGFKDNDISGNLYMIRQDDIECKIDNTIYDNKNRVMK